MAADTIPRRVDFTGLRGAWRGKTFAFDVTGIVLEQGNLQSSNVRALCTVKRFTDDADPGLAQLDTDGGDDLVKSATALRLEFTPEITDGWPSGAPRGVLVPYDVQLVIGTDVKTIQRGFIAVHEPCTHVMSPPGPLAIFDASRIAFLLQPEQWTAASWADVTGNLTVSQATASRQFANVGSINGHTVPRADGVDDTMSGTLISPLLAGTRPYLLAVLRTAAGDPGGPASGLLLQAEDAGANGIFILRYLTDSTRKLVASFRSAGNYSIAGPAPDSAPHAVELNYRADTIDRYFVDGVAYDTPTSGSTTLTTAIATDITRVYVSKGVTSPVSADFGAVLCVRDQPSDEELAALYQWITYRWGIVSS